MHVMKYSFHDKLKSQKLKCTDYQFILHCNCGYCIIFSLFYLSAWYSRALVECGQTPHYVRASIISGCVADDVEERVGVSRCARTSRLRGTAPHLLLAELAAWH